MKTNTPKLKTPIFNIQISQSLTMNAGQDIKTLNMYL